MIALMAFMTTPALPSAFAASKCLTAIGVNQTTPYTDTASYGCSMKATASSGRLTHHSWGTDVFAVSGGASGITTTITVTSTGYIGNYFSLWDTSDGTLATGWTLVGTTPAVITGSQLTAPTYNSMWTGSGTVQSTKSFSVSVAAGQVLYFRVQDAFYNAMGRKLDAPCSTTTMALVASGCTVTGFINVAAGWSPSGYTISFNPA